MGQQNSSEKDQFNVALDKQEEEYLAKLYSEISNNGELDVKRFSKLFPLIPEKALGNFPILFANLEYFKTGEGVLKPKSSRFKLADIRALTHISVYEGIDQLCRCFHLLLDLKHERSLVSWAKSFLAIELKQYIAKYEGLKVADEVSDRFLHRILSGKESDPLDESQLGAAAQYLLTKDEPKIDYNSIDITSLTEFTSFVSNNLFLQKIIRNFFIRILAPPKGELKTAENNARSELERQNSIRKIAKKKARAMMIKSPFFPNKLPEFLNAEDVWFLHFHLLGEFAQRWELMFDSVRDGFAWNPFVDRITGTGSTFIFIQDKDDYVFGCFAEKEWNVRPEWPKLQCFKATTYNDHYQYFEYGLQTLPNGLAMGGQFDYFGLFLSSEFIKGHSKADPLSSTFQNPSLSKKSEFETKHVYVLKVKAVPKEVLDRERGLKASGKRAQKQEVLDFLDMAGVQTYSKQLGVDEDNDDKED